MRLAMGSRGEYSEATLTGSGAYGGPRVDWEEMSEPEYPPTPCRTIALTPEMIAADRKLQLARNAVSTVAQEWRKGLGLGNGREA